MQRENRAFEEMRKVAVGWLEGRDPREIEARTGIAYDAGREEFALASLGREVRVGWPDCEIEGGFGEWYALLLLHYMHLADGAPLSDGQIALAQMRGGMVRGGGFDRESAARLSRLLGAYTSEEAERACAALGARFVDSNADLCAEFTLFPRFPLTLKLWFADDELPASARLMINAAAEHYLTVEDAVTAGEVLMAELERRLAG